MTDTPRSLNQIDVQVYTYQITMLLNLEIPPEVLPGVVENFERMAEIAQLVLGFELPDDLEAATAFQP